MNRWFISVIPGSIVLNGRGGASLEETRECPTHIELEFSMLSFAEGGKLGSTLKP